MKEIKWAVLGCGVIANEMAVALQKNGKNIYAVGNRKQYSLFCPAGQIARGWHDEDDEA